MEQLEDLLWLSSRIFTLGNVSKDTFLIIGQSGMTSFPTIHRLILNEIYFEFSLLVNDATLIINTEIIVVCREMERPISFVFILTEDSSFKC